MTKYKVVPNDNLQARINSWISFSAGFVIAMHAKDWWYLPISLIGGFITSFLILFSIKLFQLKWKNKKRA